jgi:hypothetical protein
MAKADSGSLQTTLSKLPPTTTPAHNLRTSSRGSSDRDLSFLVTYVVLKLLEIVMNEVGQSRWVRNYATMCGDEEPNGFARAINYEFKDQAAILCRTDEFNLPNLNSNTDA